jgi:HlyD family secretion protein
MEHKLRKIIESRRIYTHYKPYLKVSAIVMGLILGLGLFYWQVLVVQAEPQELWGNADAKEININPKVSGRIVKLVVKEGDYVEKGQVLACIDKDSVSTEQTQARATLQAQQSQLQQTMIAAHMQQQNLDAAVKSAESQAAQAQTAVDLAAKDEARYHNLLDQSAVSQQSYDTYKAKLDNANAAAVQAQAAVDSARASLEKNRENDELVNMYQAQLEAVQGKLDQVNVSADETEIKAPFSGVITKKYIEEGSLVSSTVPVYAIQDTNDNWIDFKVKETELNRFKLNHSVVLEGRNKNVQLQGHIVSISRKADFATVKATNERGDKDTITFNVKVQVNDAQVWPGMRFKLIEVE